MSDFGVTVAWVVTALVIAVSLALLINMAFEYEDQERYERRVEAHWRDVAWCEEQGGTIVYDSGQWFDECLVAP